MTFAEYEAEMEADRLRAAATGYETITRQYEGKNAPAEFMRDSARLTALGWTITSQSTFRPRIGCLRWLCLGLLALVFRPHETILVTYRRPLQVAPPAPPISEKEVGPLPD